MPYSEAEGIPLLLEEDKSLAPFCGAVRKPQPQLLHEPRIANHEPRTTSHENRGNRVDLGKGKGYNTRQFESRKEEENMKNALGLAITAQNCPPRRNCKL